MTMMEAVKTVFGNYATFSGRARRAEYWWYVLFYALVLFVFAIISGVAGAAAPARSSTSSTLAGVIGMLMVVFMLGTMIPSIAVTVRRLHDTDKSGAFYLLHLVPFGSLVLLVFAVQEGTVGPNQYGPDPLGRAGAPSMYPGHGAAGQFAPYGTPVAQPGYGYGNGVVEQLPAYGAPAPAALTASVCATCGHQFAFVPASACPRCGAPQ